MQMEYKTDGVYIDFSLDSNQLSFRGGELVLDLEEIAKTHRVGIIISEDSSGKLTTGASHRYIAEVSIPERRFTAEKTGVADDLGFPVLRKVHAPLDTDGVVLTLWASKRQG